MEGLLEVLVAVNDLYAMLEAILGRLLADASHMAVHVGEVKIGVLDVFVEAPFVSFVGTELDMVRK